MKMFLLGAAIFWTVALIFFISMSQVPAHGQIRGATCFYTGEQISGLNKICYYNCLGSTYAITVASHQICPVTIRR